MAIVQCRYGHYYDDEKYLFCPRCGVNGSSEEVKTIAMVSDRPVAQEDEAKTRGIYAGSDRVTGWLVCVKGPERGKDYHLFQGYNRIGRAFEMDVCVCGDEKIELKEHASVVYDAKGNQFLLVPGMEGFCYLNGEYQEKPARLRTGDIIGMGQSEFEFVAFCREGHVWKDEE